MGQLFCHGYSTELRHVFVCRDATRRGASHPDQGEDLEVVRVGLDELRLLLRRGEMTVTDACYVALDSLDRI